MHTLTHMLAYMRVCTCVCVCESMCIHACVCACMCIYMCMCTCILTQKFHSKQATRHGAHAHSSFTQTFLPPSAAPIVTAQSWPRVHSTPTPTPPLPCSMNYAHVRPSLYLPRNLRLHTHNSTRQHMSTDGSTQQHMATHCNISFLPRNLHTQPRTILQPHALRLHRTAHTKVARMTRIRRLLLLLPTRMAARLSKEAPRLHPPAPALVHRGVSHTRKHTPTSSITNGVPVATLTLSLVTLRGYLRAWTPCRWQLRGSTRVW